MFRQEIRRVFFSPFFYISIFILLIGSIVTVFDCLPDSDDVVYLLDVTGMGYGKALIPIMSTLAIADSYLVECQSGYHYVVMSRTKKLKYCFSKMIAAILSGMFVVLFMKLFLLVMLIIATKCYHGEFVIGSEESLQYFDNTSILILSRKFGLFIGQNILYDCLYASIFPGLSLAISTLIKNKYVVMLFPFIYSNITAFVFVGLKWYYLTPMVLGSEGRATLLPYEGFPFHIIVTLLYWIFTTIWFASGVLKEMK